MVEKSVTIINKTGMHARPASQFVKLITKYKSNIQLVKGDRSANAKSLINILSLGINAGTVINVKVDGEDEKEALDVIVDFLANLQE